MQDSQRGKLADHNALQGVGATGPGGIARIAETEVGGSELVDAVFQDGEGAIAAGWLLIDRNDVDRERVGGGIQIHAAVGSATVVAHLDGEGGVARTHGIGRRAEQQAGKAGGGDLLARDHGHTRQLQAAGRGQGGDDHALEAVGAGCAGGVDRIGETEIGSGEAVDSVFGDRDRGVAAAGGIVQRRGIDVDRVGGRIQVRTTIGCAAVIAHLEGQGVVSRAVDMGLGEIGQSREIDGADLLACHHRSRAKAQQAAAGELADHHALRAIGASG